MSICMLCGCCASRRTRCFVCIFVGTGAAIGSRGGGGAGRRASGTRVWAAAAAAGARGARGGARGVDGAERDVPVGARSVRAARALVVRYRLLQAPAGAAAGAPSFPLSSLVLSRVRVPQCVYSVAGGAGDPRAARRVRDAGAAVRARRGDARRELPAARVGALRAAARARHDRTRAHVPQPRPRTPRL